MLRGASLTVLSPEISPSVVPKLYRIRSAASAASSSGRYFIILLFTAHPSEWGPCPLLPPSHNPVSGDLKGVLNLQFVSLTGVNNRSVNQTAYVTFLSYLARAWPLRLRQFPRSRDLCGKNVISGQHRRNVPFGYLPDGNASHLFHRLSVDGGN